MPEEPDTDPTQPADRPTAPMAAEPGADERPRRLLRSHDNRVIGGAAGGLAEYFRVDPVITRIAFAVTVFFGGVGVLAYLALVLFVPNDDGTGRPAPRSWSPGRVAAIVVISIPAAIALAVGSGWAGAEGLGLIVVVLVLALGVLMVALSFRRRARWLVVPALVLAAPLGVVYAADFELKGAYGDRTYRPTSTAAIPADGYRMAMGEMRVDLTDLDWRPGRTVDLDLELGVGAIKVLVPQEVCVEADGNAFAGVLDMRGNRAEGMDVDIDERHTPSPAPRLRLHADIAAGEVKVRDRPGDFGGRDGGPFSDRHDGFADTTGRAARAVEACGAA